MKTNFKTITKQITSGIFTLLLGATILTSCDSKDDPEPNKIPNGQALIERVNQNRKDAIQIFSIDPSLPSTVQGEQGTIVYIPANAIGLNGSPVTGNIDIELVEIYNKGGMVLQDISTKAEKANGDQEALISGGEFFLNAKQGETQLEVLNPISIQSKDIMPNDWEAMQVFRAGDNLEDTDLWKEADENQDGVADNANGHEGEGPAGDIVMNNVFDVSAFGWTNLDRWAGFTGAKTVLYVDVPDGYNETNCNVYLSYDGEVGLAKMDIWDPQQELFTEHYGSIPIGKEVHFIIIADIDGQIYSKIQAATIVQDHIEIMDGLQPISETDLTNQINALP